MATSVTPSGRQVAASASADRRSAASSIVAFGRVHFWQGGSVWIGRGSGRAQWHEHHAHQIALPFEGTCRFQTGDDEDWTEFRGAFVPSERPHRFEMDDMTVAQLFVDPETAEGRALSRRFGGTGISPLPEPDRTAMAAMLRKSLDAGCAAAEVVAIARSAIAVLAGAPAASTGVDARIARALDFIRTRIRDSIRLADVAGAAALSPRHFRHLFVQETGSALRPYVLWLRLNVAIECAMAGKSWTEAAHEAGFADSAHLTRTFKRMFGMNPATLVRR